MPSEPPVEKTHLRDLIRSNFTPKKKARTRLDYRPSSVLSEIASGSLAVIAVNALDPWICAPVFRLVCLYQINREYS